MFVPVLAFIGVFSIIVLVHEFGHFLAARAAGIHVYEFSIGFPFSPRVITLFRYKETEFTLRAFPLGGFVRFVKQNGEGSHEWMRTSYCKRMFVMSSGSLANLLFAYLVFTTVSLLSTNLGIANAPLAGGFFTWHVTAETGKFFLNLFTGHGSADALFGPIGIATIAGQAVHQGLPEIMLLTGVLSLSLGIMNLLPLPAFDGGQMMLIAVEWVRKQPLQMKVYQRVGSVGLVLVLAIAVVATYQDVLRLLK